MRIHFTSAKGTARATSLSKEQLAPRSASLSQEQLAPRSVLRSFNTTQAGVATSGAAIDFEMMKGGRR